jgi:hypothetical protein
MVFILDTNLLQQPFELAQILVEFAFPHQVFVRKPGERLRTSAISLTVKRWIPILYKSAESAQ